MISKIDIRSILKDHFGTLKSYNPLEDYDLDVYSKKPYNKGDLFLFFIFPIFIAGLLLYFSVKLNPTTIGTLITVFSVFTALLFNLLMLIYDIISKDKTRVKTIFIKEIYSNVAFSIFIALFSIVVLALTLYTIKDNAPDNTDHTTTAKVFTFGAYYLIVNFLLTLLMILQRVHVLLSKECDDQYKKINDEIKKKERENAE
ncbi:MAG: hypothetical protein WAQ98_14725 [Blastocatellia bacterium]